MSVLTPDRQIVVEWAARLRAAVAPLERHLRQQGADPYTPTQLSVIGAIYRHGPIPIGELASRERLSAPTISKVVASLEAAGIVERFPDAQDRRVCRVAITPAGQRWITKGRAQRNEWLADKIINLSAADRAALASAIPVLERLIGEET